MKTTTLSIVTLVAGLLISVPARGASGSFALPGASGGLSDTQSSIGKAVHDATASRDEDPLKYIAKDMGSVVVDLDKLQTDHPVQAKEERCVADLDAVIKKLEAAMKKGSGGGGSLNPSRPMADSVIAGGPGGIRDLHDPKASERQWGNLPPKQREQILQSKTDGFPPGYEAILQSYYRRLAQEQLAGDEKSGSNSAATPTTNPASR
jgi:hypothetical protein